MTNRIEELAKEYHFVHEFMTASERNDAMQKYKKFGELIVQECLLKARGAKIRGESIDQLIERFVDDFGVKE